MGTGRALTVRRVPVGQAEDRVGGQHRLHAREPRRRGDAAGDPAELPHGRRQARAGSAWEEDLQTIDEWLRGGQPQGEFGAFDTRAMALFILSLRNGVIQRYHFKPDPDLHTIARELIRLVDLATRRSRPGE